ncbi:PX domain-containing protein [Chitinophaga pinensis]|uniref:Pyridoxamine 5'-phosphate oxidase putative domain-containing protein n=1 Tax=Chitinophaga pinensis (strain ATCC 43595 / DSM 2588 / LMG 13176 / NBRC 15968 / NCIMB 11800 / UQM 2034) TaxID=485918 RepID=A0A979G3B1_CHIPD|nr:hypothetical protein [Chitinophaga pinensis]ACU60162.1 hypothetical protein Cpin_2680 [Chitinophaga pinensis DSM 2588]
MNGVNEINDFSIATLAGFFNSHHDKLLCTADKNGAPNIALMGTPRMTDNGSIELELSDEPSITLRNMRENKEVVFMLYLSGQRARDYSGARVYAEVTEIITSGEKLEKIRAMIRERFGNEKADELKATVTCRIKKVRPVVDRGQQWNEAAFENA